MKIIRNGLEYELTPEVLQEQWINKWDGKLPKVTDGNTMIGLDNLK